MTSTFFFSETIYIFIGVFAGLMAGALGIGGGTIVVPGLLFFFQAKELIPSPYIMHSAVGTSLAVMICTSLASLRAHHQLAAILWPLFYKLGPGIALGACTGAFAAAFIPTYGLKILFTCFLFAVAFKMLADLHEVERPRLLSDWLSYLLSFLIGILSALLGIGGGILVIPLLGYMGIPLRQIIPVANLCSFTIAVIGTLFFMLMGYQQTSSVPYATGYIYWPAVLGIAIPSFLAAPYGARLNYKMPIHYLKIGFIILLMITALKMLF